MPLISKVVNWDVFSTPPIEPVQYYSILKKRREFSLLIQQYDSQVVKHGYLHYCCIVPKNNSSSLNCKYDMFILFFNEITNTSFIGFRLQVSKDTFVNETNLLLLFLKNSNKAICYLMNNNCIHVKCTISDAWELFYCLYGEYLKRYVLTVIGTQFFYSFTYLHFIQMEKQLLTMLYKGSKTVKISKKSVFYKIHRKRKVSVSELIHITHNMPKNKKHVMSCFRFKESPAVFKENKSHIFNKSSLVSTCTQEKMNEQFEVTFRDVSVNTSLSTEAVCYSSCVKLDSVVYCDKMHEFKQPHEVPKKRKFQEIDVHDSKIISSSSSKLFKKTESGTNDRGDFWEDYYNFTPYSIKSYSNTPCLKNIVPRLLKDGEKHNSEQEDMSSSTFSVNKRNTKESTLAVKKMFTEMKSRNQKKECSHIVASPLTSENISPRNTLVRPCNNETDGILNNASNTPLNNTLGNWDGIFFDDLTEVSFSTAAGKTINISDAAILSAHKIMKDVLNEKAQTSENKVYKPSSFKDISNNLKKLNPNENAGKTRVSEELLFKKKGIESCNVLKKFETEKCAIENLNEDFEDVSFTTAGGKNINVSNSAMLVAQKIMKNVLAEEKKQLFEEDTNLIVCKKRKYSDLSAFQDNSSQSKKIPIEINDLEMNVTLVEKFFADSSFEEKEIEPTECMTNKTSCVDSESNKNKSLPNYKPKKSLGGRRSLRYSDKL